MRSFSEGMLEQIEAVSKGVLYLLEIDLPSAVTLRYVNCVDDVEFGEETYVSKSFIFPAVVADSQLTYRDVAVTVANLDHALGDVALTQDLRGCAVRVKQVFFTSEGVVDTDLAGEDYILLISGRVEDVSITQSIFTLRVRSPLAALERTIPVRNFGTACPWIFGDTDCGYDAEATALADQALDADSTATLILDSARTEADDYWRDGIIEITSGTLSGERRRILSSTEGEITLERPLPGIPAAGVTYDIAQGCDKSWDTCGDRFDNQSEFGGFVSLPAEILKT